MGLIHWWPLNGNTDDLGLNPISLHTIGTISYDDAGKIGKALSCTSSNGLWFSGDLGIGNTHSISAWFYVASGANSGWGAIAILNTDGGDSDTKFGLYAKESSSDPRCQVTANGSYYSTISYTMGSWHNLVSTYDGTTLKGYLDGILISTTTITSAELSKNNFSIGCRSASPSGAGTSNAAHFIGKLNDIRIYDYALSAKEVKEISKGLVLHYNFEDEYIEPTTNLVDFIEAGGQTTVSNGIVTTSGISADTYFTLHMSESLIADTVYSISCDAEIPEGSWSFPIGGQGNTALTFVIYNGHNEYTFTMNGFNAGTNRCFMDDVSRNAAANHQCKMWNWQIEKKNHATPYVKWERSGEKVYDSSGYGNNGTVTGSPQIVSDSGNGLHSISSNGDARIAITGGLPIANGSGFTVSTWVKDDGQHASNWWSGITSPQKNLYFNLGPDSGGGVQFGVFTGTQLYQALAPNVANTWTHWVGVFNGTYAYLYKNGTLVATAAASSYSSSITDNTSYILCGPSSNSYVKISDYKLFSTALSQEDILIEYNRKASIDRNGNLFTGEFIEQDSEELTPGVYLGPDANYIDNGYAASTVTKDNDSSIILTSTTWVATPKFNVTYGDTYYYDIVYSNTSGNQFYLGYEQYDDAGNSGSNNLCRYLISGDTNARDHYRIKGTITVNSTTSAGTQVTKWKLRVLNAWNGSSSSKIAKIHHISLRKVSTLTPAKIDKSNFIVANDFREDENYTTAQLYKDGFVGAREIIEN